MNQLCVLAAFALACAACSCTGYGGQIVLDIDNASLGSSAAAVRGAATRWEQHTGLDLFVENPSATEHVRVIAREDCLLNGETYEGYSDLHWSSTSGSMHGEIWLCAKTLSSTSAWYAQRVSMHEFGHALQLEHVSERSNVMWPHWVADKDEAYTVSEEQIAQVRDEAAGVPVL